MTRLSRCQVYLLGMAALLGGCASDPVVLESTEGGTEDVAPLVPPTAEPPAIPEPTATESQPSIPLETAQYIGETLFACRTAEDKVIEVYDMGTTIQYAFGPKEQLELVLDVPREQASTYQWQGIGRYENYSVSIPNGDTVYSVFWARDRLNIEQPPEAGVSVEIDGEYVTTVDCATDVTHNLIGVDLLPTPL